MSPKGKDESFTYDTGLTLLANVYRAPLIGGPQVP